MMFLAYKKIGNFKCLNLCLSLYFRFKYWITLVIYLVKIILLILLRLLFKFRVRNIVFYILYSIRVWNIESTYIYYSFNDIGIHKGIWFNLGIWLGLKDHRRGYPSPNSNLELAYTSFNQLSKVNGIYDVHHFNIGFVIVILISIKLLFTLILCPWNRNSEGGKHNIVQMKLN